MGLDNIPHIYPCETMATTIKTDDGRIDCTANIEAGSCPWKAAVDRSMFATEGGDDGPDLSPEYARNLAGFIRDNGEAYAAAINKEEPEYAEGGAAVRDWMYSAFWLEWCADNAGGVRSWY